VPGAANPGESTHLDLGHHWPFPTFSFSELIVLLGNTAARTNSFRQKTLWQKTFPEITPYRSRTYILPKSHLDPHCQSLTLTRISLKPHAMTIRQAYELAKNLESFSFSWKRWSTPDFCFDAFS
jgi:hypothetical protein